MGSAAGILKGRESECSGSKEEKEKLRRRINPSLRDETPRGRHCHDFYKDVNDDKSTSMQVEPQIVTKETRKRIARELLTTTPVLFLKTSALLFLIHNQFPK